MTLGQKIAFHRKDRDWTQEFLAREVGVHVRHVSRWETGRHKPPPKMLQRLAEIFGVQPEDFIGGPSEPLASADPEMLADLQLLQELDSNDRNTVRQVIRAFATKRKVAQLVAS